MVESRHAPLAWPMPRAGRSRPSKNPAGEARSLGRGSSLSLARLRKPLG